MIIPSRLLLSVAMSLGVAAAPASATNIVLNPGFEQGGFGWDSSHYLFLTKPLWAYSGVGSARLSYCSRLDYCLDNLFEGAYLSQVLATRPGERYDMSFWVRSFAGDSRISVFWDGVELLKTPTPNGPMIQYSFSALAASAANTLLEVHSYNGTDQHLSFDEFSVTQVAPPGSQLPPVGNQPPPGNAAPVHISEPGIYGLMLAALGALVMAQRRVQPGCRA